MSIEPLITFKAGQCELSVRFSIHSYSTTPLTSTGKRTRSQSQATANARLRLHLPRRRWCVQPAVRLYSTDVNQNSTTSAGGHAPTRMTIVT